MTTIDVSLRAADLGKELENISAEVEATFKLAVAGLAQSAYSEVIRLANQRLKSTKQDYVNAVTFESVGENIYVITLNGKAANATEDGYGSFDMKPGLLSGPNSKVTAKGTRFNTVPFSYQPNSNAPAGQKILDLRSAVKALIKDRGIDKIIKNPSGEPKQGIVARLSNTGIKNLEGLVKIQKQYGKTTQSTYMTFRRVSSNSDASKWIHPGYQGARIFPDVERFIEQDLDRIIMSIL